MTNTIKPNRNKGTFSTAGSSSKKSDKPLIRFCFEGDFSSPTASGRFARELALAARGVELPLSITERKTYLHSKDFPLPDFFKKIADRPFFGGIRVVCFPAFNLPEKVDKGRYWAISAFDPYFDDPNNIRKPAKPGMIWLPSKAHLNACQKAGMPTARCRLLIPPVNTRIFHPRVPHHKMLAEFDEFLFIAVVSPLRRKGADLILRAFIEEFKASEPVRLIIKLTHLPKLKKSFKHEISDFGKRLGALNRMFPPVTVIAQILEERELAALLAGCQAFVSANRGYQTALATREAMAAGLPLIAPDALFEILEIDETFGYSVKTCRQTVSKDLLFPNSPEGVIREVDIAHLRRQMREAFSHPASARKKGLTAHQRQKNMPSWKDAVQELVSASNEPESANGKSQK